MSTSQRNSISKRKTTRSDNLFSNAFNKTRATVAPKESTTNQNSATSATKTSATLVSVQPTFQMNGSTTTMGKTAIGGLQPSNPSTSMPVSSPTKQKSPKSPQVPQTPTAPMISRGQTTTQAPVTVVMKQAPERAEHPV